MGVSVEALDSEGGWLGLKERDFKTETSLGFCKSVPNYGNLKKDWSIR